MTVSISPVFNIPYFTDNAGVPLSGGKIYQYNGGSSSVLKATYTSSTGLVANANPIVLNSAGQLHAGINIWLTDGELYNLVLTAPDGTTVLKGFDKVTGVVAQQVQEGVTAEIWVATPGATYLTPTSFRTTGNFTQRYAVGNRVRLTLSSGFTYGTVTAVAFSSPNTTVTIINDGAVLNSSISVCEYSLLTTAGKTVDGGAVTFQPTFTYANTTVAGKINEVNSTLTTSIAAVEAKRARDTKVPVTTGSGTNTPYEITLTPPITSYTSNAVYVVKFASASIAAATLDIDGVGAKRIKQYNSSGAKVTPVIVAGMLSQVAYDGTDFILLDPLPAVPVSAETTPRGGRQFTANGTFTTPTDVYFLKVTCAGGGGAGGLSTYWGCIETGTYGLAGGTGGAGAAYFKHISTTPGTSYAVAIGAGGVFGVSGGRGGTTSFGVSVVAANGGYQGGAANCSSGAGANGAPGGGGTGFGLRGGASAWGHFGSGGASEGSGFAGLCVIEW